MRGRSFSPSPAPWLRLAVLLTLVASCVPLSNGDVHVIEAWLTRDPPDPVDAARVRDLGTDLLKGEAARSYLGNALLGPEAAAPENLRHRFRDSYRRTPQPVTSQSDYVSHYMENFLAMYQVRAALALGAIGGDDATGHLELAVVRDWAGIQPLRDDVRAIVLSSLSSSRWDEFQGTATPAYPGVLDTVTVQPGANPFDGDERVRLLGGPFSGDVVVDSGATLSFVVAAPVGLHRPIVTGVRSPADTLYFELAVGSIAYRGHPPEDPVEVVGHPTPGRIYSVLSGRVSVQSGGVVRDIAMDRELGTPIDHFRVEAPPAAIVTRMVTATAEWHGRGSVKPVWTDCGGSYGGAPRFQGYVLGEDSEPLGSATVTVFIGPAEYNLVTTSGGRFSFIPPGPTAHPDSVRVTTIGYARWTFSGIRLSNRDHFLWLGGYQPVVAPPPGPIVAPLPMPIAAPIVIPSPAPYHVLRKVTAVADLPPGECRMLKLVKLGDEEDYVIVRLGFAFDPPL